MEESNLHHPPAIGLGDGRTKRDQKYSAVQCAVCCVLTRAIHGYGRRGQRKEEAARASTQLAAVAMWAAALAAPSLPASWAAILPELGCTMAEIRV